MLPVIPAILWGGSALLGAYGATQGTRGLIARSDAKDIYAKLKNREDALNARRDALIQRSAVVDEQDARRAKQADALFDAYAQLAEEIEQQLLRTYNQARSHQTSDTREKIGANDERNVWKRTGKAVVAAAGGAAAGYAARHGAFLAIKQLGTASTGTAIRALSGAAAKRATLSAAGGGARLAGGAGMAGGTAALNVVVAGVSIAYYGQKFLSSQQAKLEEAQKVEEEANAELNVFENQLDTFEAGLMLEEARVSKASDLYKKLKRELQRAQKLSRENHAERASDVLVFVQDDLQTLASMIRRPVDALTA